PIKILTKQMICLSGVWIPERLLIKAKEQDPDFNLSHYVTHQLQKDYGTAEEQVDYFLEHYGGVAQ
ncbi:unnamed protein product, partial [marine sediment metagenome]